MKINEIFLCAQCAVKVTWPKEMRRAERQPSEKQACKLCGRKCYGTMYDLGKGEEQCPTTGNTDSRRTSRTRT